MSEQALILPESAGIADVAALRETLFTLIDEGAGASLTVDCSAVRSIDAASLQCLLVARRKAQAAGGTLALANPSEDFKRYVSYVGLSADLIN